MKAAEVRDMTPDQLNDKLVELKKEAYNLRFQKATGQLENTSQFKQIRRDVARIQTMLNVKQAEASAK